MYGYNEGVAYSNVKIVKVNDNIVSHRQTCSTPREEVWDMDIEAVCRIAPWSAYQSQNTIQSNDTYLM